MNEINTKYRRGRKRRVGSDRQKGIRQFLKDSPFLIVSFIFHLIILLLLAFITAQEPREVPQRIRVEVEEIYDEEVEIQPTVTETDLSTDPMADGGEGAADGAGGGEGFAEAAGAAEGVEAPSPDIIGAERAMGGGDAGDFGDRTGDGFDIAAGEGEGVAGAVDQFAVVTMNSAAQGKTLVVLTIDRTRSVVYLNLPRLIERMSHYFEALDQNLTTDMRDNVRWVVVGYGQDVTFHTRPTDDLEHLESALRSVEVCPTGDQNLGAALNTVLDRYGDYGHRRMLVATMTDGYGCDLRDGRLLERTIERLRATQASLFVFGDEAAFASNRKRKSLSLDPDLLQPEDRATIRGFEGETIHDWVDAGPAAPRRELWSGNRHWGWDDRHLPLSGFGMYAQNRMVLATGGIYFLLEDESDYDDEKLYSRYAPDICSVAEYDRRMEEEPLRAALKRTWEEIPNLYLRGPGHTHNGFQVLRITEEEPRDTTDRANQQVRENLERAREGRRYTTERAEQLKELLEEPEVRSMENYTRWRAHAQITIAELKRMRFMLGQYAEVLSTHWQQHDRDYTLQSLFSREKLEGAADEEPGTRYYISLREGSAPEDFVGPREARDEYDEAKEYAQIIIEEHSDTPWELLAERIKNNLHPWTPSPGLRSRGRGCPSPPQLAL